MKNFDWLLNTPIAHRGLHDNTCAENSMTAYKAAILKGFSIEIDVHPSSDGKVIIFHDYTLTRVCGVELPTTSVCSTDREKYKLNNTEDFIPLLAELLKLIDGKVGLLIEIKYKNNKYYRKLCPMVYALIKDYKGPVAIQSFSPTVVRWFKRNAPEITRGLLATSYGELKVSPFVRNIMRRGNRIFGGSVIRIINPDFLAFNILSLPSPTVARIRAKGLPVITWTVRQLDQIPIAEDCATNIIFEKIDISSFKKK